MPRTKKTVYEVLEPELKYNRKALEVNFSRIKEIVQESDENLQHLKELSLKAEQKDKYLGSFFSLNVADGHAYYQAVEYNKTADRYLVKRCLGICLDEYADGYLGEWRWADGDYVRQMVESRKSLERLFSR